MKALAVSFAGGLGGAERLLLQVACGLDEPPLIACPDGPLAAAARERGLGVFELPVRSLEVRRSLRDRAAAGLAIASHAAAVRSLLAVERPDVLVAWGMRAGLVLAAAGTGRAPVLLQHQDMLPGPLIARAVRHAARRAEAVVTCSACVAADLDPSRLLGDRISVVHPGVDLERFRPAAGRSREVLVLGAIERWKRPDLALEALALVATELPDVRLRVAGAPLGADGRRLEADLRERAARPDLRGRVEITGTHQDPVPALRGAACLLHCAEREPYGMVVVEAMACGLPVVAPDSCGPAEIVARDHGRLYAPGDAAAAARALTEVLGDPERANRMGAAGRAAAERRMTAHWMCERYSELLARLARSGPAAGAPATRPRPRAMAPAWRW